MMVQEFVTKVDRYVNNLTTTKNMHFIKHVEKKTPVLSRLNAVNSATLSQEKTTMQNRLANYFKDKLAKLD